MDPLKVRLFGRTPMFADTDPDAGGGGASGVSNIDVAVGSAGEGGAGTPDVSRETTEPSKPDLDRILNWDPETDGDLPDEFKNLPIDEIREVVNKQKTETAAEVEARVRNELLQQQEREREQNKSRADQEKEIQWAEDLEQRRRSEDPAVREAANREYDSYESRYIKALAARNSIRERGEVLKAVNTFLSPQLQGLIESGHEEFASNFSQKAAEHGNNLLMAAIEYGKSLGDADGYTRGKEEAEQAGRVNGNAGSPPANGGSGTGTDLYAGIDKTKPGAAQEMMRRALTK